MNLKQITQIQIYHLKSEDKLYPGINSTASVTQERSAKVYFVKKGKSEKWEFQKCDYKTWYDNEYDLQDWEFLSNLYLFIEDKLAELNR